MNIDITPLLKQVRRDLNDFERTSAVKVGIFDPNLPARQGDGSKPRARLQNSSSAIKRLAIKRKTDPNAIRLRELLKLLDAERGVMTKFKQSSTYSQDVKRVAAEFANLYAAGMRDPDTIKQLLNACQAIVRNPILAGQYGGNSPRWEKYKGNNRYAIATGTTFTAIKAVMVHP